MINVKHGFILIDKPAEITSHDVIDRLRRITGIKKIGHAGTLDPFATGLLIVAIGREATREIKKFVGLDKTYEAEFVLGATTETLDPESEVKTQVSPPVMEGWGEAIENEMKTLTGEIEQIPPMYSAIKIKGKKLYELARKGKTIERKPRSVVIHEFTLLDEPNAEDGLTILSVRVRCSSGTYIRALARDLAEKLETTGYVKTLKRTEIGKYHIENALPLSELTIDKISANLFM